MLSFNDFIPLQNKSIDLLAVGELLVDMISETYDDVVDSDTYHKFLGGSAANIAMNAKKLGLRSQVVSAVGNDGFGTFLIRKLQEAGVPTHGVQRTPHPTSLVVVTKSKATPVPIFYRGADYHLSFTPQLEQAVIDSKIIHFSCWPLSMPSSRSTIERVLELARKHNTLIGFDPNYHPMIWNEGEDGVAYVKSVIGKTDIIKPSEDDAERLFGKDTPERQLEKFLRLGAKWVILTLGKAGAIVSNGSETMKIASAATDVVDTTGAGDAFWAGFYAGIVKGFSFKDAVMLGMKVSAFKLKHLGPVASFPTIEEMVANK
mgnify:CR=1 FL=1